MEPVPMLRRAALAALLAAPLPAAAAGPIEGAFAIEGLSCAADSDARLTVGPEGFTFYESTCTILSETDLGFTGARTMRLACAGEGETWEDTILAFVDVAGRLTVFFETGESYRAEPCP